MQIEIIPSPVAENTQILCKGKYQCMAGLLLYWSTKQVYLLKICCRIQTSQTGGQLYSDNYPYEVSEYSLPL